MLKEITVSQAIHLPHNFPIETLDDDYKFYGDKIESINSEFSKYSDKGTITTEDTCEDLLPDDAIRVDSDKYKDVLIQKIREIFENKYQKVRKIEKRQTGNWRGMAHIELETASTIIEMGEPSKEFWCTSSRHFFPSNIDPMPWEEEYEIEIK